MMAHIMLAGAQDEIPSQGKYEVTHQKGIAWDEKKTQTITLVQEVIVKIELEQPFLFQ